MKVPNVIHEAHGWAIAEVVPDFELLDVWALPVQGDAEDFRVLLELFNSGAFDPRKADSLPARFLWVARDRIGGLLGLGRISEEAPSDGPGLPIPGTDELTLFDRLPDKLRATASGMNIRSVPFTPLYLTDDEFAAEISNRTVHGVMHLSWVDQGRGCYRAEMAVYVKPRGPLGEAYMRLIEPFRQYVVYPAMMRQLARVWESRRPVR